MTCDPGRAEQGQEAPRVELGEVEGRASTVPRPAVSRRPHATPALCPASLGQAWRAGAA